MLTKINRKLTTSTIIKGKSLVELFYTNFQVPIVDASVVQGAPLIVELVHRLHGKTCIFLFSVRYHEWLKHVYVYDL